MINYLMHLKIEEMRYEFIYSMLFIDITTREYVDIQKSREKYINKIDIKSVDDLLRKSLKSYFSRSSKKGFLYSKKVYYKFIQNYKEITNNLPGINFENLAKWLIIFDGISRYTCEEKYQNTFVLKISKLCFDLVFYNKNKFFIDDFIQKEDKDSFSKALRKAFVDCL